MAFTPTLRRAAAQFTYSGYAPKISIPRSVAGFTAASATRTLNLAGSFGVAAGVGAIFFLGEVPRVRRDILQQLPFLDTYFDRTIPPEDNPF